MIRAPFHNSRPAFALLFEVTSLVLTVLLVALQCHWTMFHLRARVSSTTRTALFYRTLWVVARLHRGC